MMVAPASSTAMRAIAATTDLRIVESPFPRELSCRPVSDGAPSRKTYATERPVLGRTGGEDGEAIFGLGLIGSWEAPVGDRPWAAPDTPSVRSGTSEVRRRSPRVVGRGAIRSPAGTRCRRPHGGRPRGGRS